MAGAGTRKSRPLRTAQPLPGAPLPPRVSRGRGVRIHGWGAVGNVRVAPLRGCEPSTEDDIDGFLPAWPLRDRRHASNAPRTSPGIVEASTGWGADAATPNRLRAKGELPLGVRCRVTEIRSPLARRSTVSCASGKSRPKSIRARTRLTGCSIGLEAWSTRSTGIPEARWSVSSLRSRSRRSSASFNDDRIDVSLSQDRRTDRMRPSWIHDTHWITDLDV